MSYKISDLVPKKYERRELNWNHFEAIASHPDNLVGDMTEAILQLRARIDDLEKALRISNLF